MEKIAVVIPSYKVTNYILDVIAHIGNEVSKIYVVDDCCPNKSGEFVQKNCHDLRVKVLYNSQNLGVGGATITGFKEALKDGVDIIVKVDGDGQIDPTLIPFLIRPLLNKQADFAKGNRFYTIESLVKMPITRLIGNTGLSFITKASTGYWNLMDPTNGFFAINSLALSLLPLEKINKRFFFESDLLFRLGIIRAVICDVPINALYANEISNLNIFHCLITFPIQHIKCFFKRLFYSYVLRDFNLCSLEIFAGSILFLIGSIFAIYLQIQTAMSGIATPLGSIMVAAILLLLGFQLILTAIMFDVQNVPKKPLIETFERKIVKDKKE